MSKKSTSQNLIQELGLENLPEEKQAELLTAMTESIIKRITVMILEKLSESEKEEFARLREDGDPDKISEFLRAKIENYDQLVSEIVQEFKQELKATVQELKQDLAQ